MVALAGAGAARAQQIDTPRRLGPMVRVEAGALNPDRLDAATMSFGMGAGLAWHGRTMLMARVLRQSQNRNSGADLTRNARDIVSLLLERTFGPEEQRRLQYFVRAGAGVMFRSPRETSPVMTVGVGARYPFHRTVTLVSGFEIDLADLIGGSYDTYRWDPDLGVYTAERTAAKLQPNYGFLMAVEWHPLP